MSNYNFNFGTSIPVGFNFYFGTTALVSGTFGLGALIFPIVPTDISGSIGAIPYKNLNAILVGISQFEQLVVKSTAISDYPINSINIEHLGSEDVLYVNTISGIVRIFSPTCSGTIDDRNIVDSDYASGNCGAEIIWEGTSNKVIELNTASGTYEEFLLNGDVSCLLYYMY